MNSKEQNKDSSGINIYIIAFIKDWEIKNSGAEKKKREENKLKNETKKIH